MRRIVVGVDGSAASDEALRWGMDEARHWDGKVMAIHAWEPPYAMYGVAGTLPLDDAVLETAAKQLLMDALARTVEEPPFALDERLVRGGAAAVLLDAARHADLLVVGSRRHGPLGRLVLGSVSTVCTHHAPCPVVVVPEPHTAEEDQT